MINGDHMVIKKIDELKGNEVLERALMTWDYQIILPEGVTLRAEYIEKIKELGIDEVCVREEETLSSEIVILQTEIENAVKEKVKDILERHTYQHNEELAGLSMAADSIITNIIQEEEVIERIYDIKQRSADIYEHSISICSMAILTALKLGLEKSSIHDIGVGCLLHDIGHRYITFELNNKVLEQFSEREQAEYRKHPVYGYSALQDEKWISLVSKSIVLYHHECLDGSGFPLRTPDLPVECRIVAICDAFDEMICGIACERLKVHEAIEYMKTYKNIKYDGKILDVFLGFTAVYPSGTHVMTNEGEVGVVLYQNKDFHDRPVIRIIKDKDGKNIKDNVIMDLVKTHNVFIEKVID